jgi:hypothetical protein
MQAQGAGFALCRRLSGADQAILERSAGLRSNFLLRSNATGGTALRQMAAGVR